MRVKRVKTKYRKNETSAISAAFTHSGFYHQERNFSECENVRVVKAGFEPRGISSFHSQIVS